MSNNIMSNDPVDDESVELSVMVERIIQKLQGKFELMSTELLGKIENMNDRVNELENSITNLIHQTNDNPNEGIELFGPKSPRQNQSYYAEKLKSQPEELNQLDEMQEQQESFQQQQQQQEEQEDSENPLETRDEFNDQQQQKENGLQQENEPLEQENFENDPSAAVTSPLHDIEIENDNSLEQK